MAKMAVGTPHIVVGAPVIPVADHTRSEDQQRDERQRNSEYPNRLSHGI